MIVLASSLFVLGLLFLCRTRKISPLKRTLLMISGTIAFVLILIELMELSSR